MTNQEKLRQVKQAMFCMTRQCWEQGIVAQALLETGDYENLERVVYDMVLRQSEDGRLCNVENTPAVTDSSFCVPAVYLLGKERKNEEMVKAAERNVAFLLGNAERAEDGTLYHMIHTRHVWADSAAFLPYVLAMTGHEEEGLAQMKGICKRLYHKETGLYFHMWDDGKDNYLRALPWGIGNGWILSGILRLYLVLDETYAQKKEALLKKWKDLLDTMLTYETQNHLFRDIMDDETSFEESEASELIAYCIYRGVHEGMLPRTYVSRADAIRRAVEDKVSSQGLVLDAASSPDFVRPGTAPECQAHYLMMEYMADLCS